MGSINHSISSTMSGINQSIPVKLYAQSRNELTQNTLINHRRVVLVMARKRKKGAWEGVHTEG